VRRNKQNQALFTSFFKKETQRTTFFNVYTLSLSLSLSIYLSLSLSLSLYLSIYLSIYLFCSVVMSDVFTLSMIVLFSWMGLAQLSKIERDQSGCFFVKTVKKKITTHWKKPTTKWRHLLMDEEIPTSQDYSIRGTEKIALKYTRLEMESSYLLGPRIMSYVGPRLKSLEFGEREP